MGNEIYKSAFRVEMSIIYNIEVISASLVSPVVEFLIALSPCEHAIFPANQGLPFFQPIG